MRSKLVVGSVYGVITAALITGTTAFVGLDKSVTISIDGQVTHVRTYASSVDSALQRAGVSVGAHDAITPSMSASVHNGTHIVILRGRPVTLIIDGVTRHAWVNGADVDQVLQQVGLRVPDAALTTSRDTRVPLTGLNISINMPHAVTVHVDGTSREVVSTKTTVAALLAEAGITLRPADQIEPSLQTRPFDGLTIVIVRVSADQQLTTAPIPFATTTVNDPTSLVGTKKVKQAGANGTLVSTFDATFDDGVQVAKTLVSQQVTVPPTPQIIGVGTKPKPLPKPKPIVYPVAADGLNWAALAGCEAGGRANADNPPFYGMYQFRLGTWEAVGGKGLPSQASASEQTYRAQLLYKRSNWRTQWPVCGHLLFS